jgi:hypothetical protein
MKILVKYVVAFPCLGCEHADVPEEGLPPVHRQLQGKTYFRVHIVRSAVSIRNYFFAIYIKNAYICILYVRELSE